MAESSDRPPRITDPDWAARRFPVLPRPAGEAEFLRTLPLAHLVRAVEQQQAEVDQHMVDAESAEGELRRIRAAGGTDAARVPEERVEELAVAIDRVNAAQSKLRALIAARDWRRSFEAGEKSGERHGRILMWLYWWPGRRLWLLLMILGAVAVCLQTLVGLFGWLFG